MVGTYHFKETKMAPALYGSMYATFEEAVEDAATMAHLNHEKVFVFIVNGEYAIHSVAMDAPCVAELHGQNLDRDAKDIRG